MNELVWCVPRSLWDEKYHFEGYKEDKDGEMYRFLLENGMFKERVLVEEDKSFKQVIPQGLLRHRDKVYVNQRLSKQTESRLGYSHSLGVGGHLNPEDNLLPHMDIIQMGLHREMSEEVELPKPFSMRYIGITNDERTEVSQMHVGVWFEIGLLSDEVSVREKEKIDGFWRQLSELEDMSNLFESWAFHIYSNYLSTNRH